MKKQMEAQAANITISVPSVFPGSGYRALLLTQASETDFIQYIVNIFWERLNWIVILLIVDVGVNTFELLLQKNAEPREVE